ncbi:MAG TPA: hypothetical protein VGQ47_03680 [Candidatus Limnocylindrales bacterium]|jgi:hypothetical protein|nr:hypothetical protein [Candidatus Limnocylindrales bacterium]
MSQRTGKVRAARLTDLAALGELSRLSHGSDGRDAAVRSLGLPVSASQISVFSLFRMPLGAFQPHDALYVYEDDGRVAGLLRVERESVRDEWTIVELDAVGAGDAGDIRYRLVQHLLRDGAKRGAARFHVACADEGGNVELFMQAGFARYGEERILFRSPDRALPQPVDQASSSAARIRTSVPLDALALSRLYADAAPFPVRRLEAYRLPDWERQGSQWRVPRSSLTPILRFADVEGYVQEAADGETLAGFLQVGVAKEEQPHYLKVIAQPGHDAGELLRFGLGVIADRARREARLGRRHEHGVISPVRTYEAPIDRRLEEQGFRTIATVSLLLKETLVRVAEPALVPAIH